MSAVCLHFKRDMKCCCFLPFPPFNVLKMLLFLILVFFLSKTINGYEINDISGPRKTVASFMFCTKQASHITNIVPICNMISVQYSIKVMHVCRKFFSTHGVFI